MRVGLPACLLLAPLGLIWACDGLTNALHGQGGAAGAFGGDGGFTSEGGSSGAAGSTGAAGVGGADLGGSAGAGGNGGSAGGTEPPVGGSVGKITVDDLPHWKGNAKAAYTIIHDDLCDNTVDSQFDTADVELSARGLRAGFGAIVSKCVERNLWFRVEGLRGHGHEILNHSWSHPDMLIENTTTTTPGLDIQKEFDQAGATLDANLRGQKTSYYIFPYDDYNDELLNHLATLGYTGARGGPKADLSNRVNPFDFADPLRSTYDVYAMIGDNSIYHGKGDITKLYVDDAIAKGGWAIREFHGVGDNSWEPIALSAYRAHLDYVLEKVASGDLWVEAPSSVVRYRFAREQCGKPNVSGKQLLFGINEACARYATELSVTLHTEADVAKLNAYQGGRFLVTQKLGSNHYEINADPLAGPIWIGGG